VGKEVLIPGPLAKFLSITFNNVYAAKGGDGIEDHQKGIKEGFGDRPQRMLLELSGIFWGVDSTFYWAGDLSR